MFYIDPERNFNIFTYGKTGTMFLTSIISIYLEDKSFTVNYKLDPIIHNNTHLPIYPLDFARYDFYKKLYSDKTNYLIIREPDERLASGLVENLYTMICKSLITTPISFDDIHKNFREILSFDLYHTGPYLSKIESFDDSVLIDINNISNFAKHLFNFDDNDLTTNPPRITVNSTSKKSLILTDDFREQIKRQNSLECSKLLIDNVDAVLLKLFFRTNMRSLGGDMFINMLAEENTIYNKYKEQVITF